MWPSRRRGVVIRCAMLMTLAGCVGVLLAQSALRGGGGSADIAVIDDETTGALGPIGGRRLAGTLPLSDEQRGRIFDSVMKLPDTPVVDATPPELAEALPGGVALQDLPAGVAREIPLVAGHKFVKFDDRILVVNPASRLVVAMIPRYKLLQ
jgi:hypothetical protein